MLHRVVWQILIKVSEEVTGTIIIALMVQSLVSIRNLIEIVISQTNIVMKVATVGDVFHQPK
jgi:hypothetical protein